MHGKIAQEQTIDGLGVSAGIGIGVAYVCDTGGVRIPEYHIGIADVETEKVRLNEAVTRTYRQISRLRSRARARAKANPELSADEIGFILDAYLQMLKNSRLIRGAVDRIVKHKLNAEAALQLEVSSICEGFRTIQDQYLASRADDVREVGKRLLLQLMKESETSLSRVPNGSIIISEEVTPADAAQLDPENVVGIAAQMGGMQGHTAIMARALGLPTVLGAAGLLSSVRNGDPILVDGDLGRIVINPTPPTIETFTKRQEQQREEKNELKQLASRPAITKDGTRISLQANIELPIEMDSIHETGAEGIGLLRTEFLFMNRRTPPNEDEQYETLRRVVERANGQTVTIRTLDLGGEKSGSGLRAGWGTRADSALGMRGIRFSLARPELLDAQYRAILRCSIHGPIRLLLPMVTGVSEVRAARDFLARSARRLIRKGIKIPTALPPLGVMIEVPGAALTADTLARSADFFAIGSNDLTMYTLAIARGDERVAHLYDPLHPGVLRVIQFAAAAALRARIPISVCGEIAADPRFTALLIGLGIRELSMAPASIPKIKQNIMNMNVIAAERRAQTIMEETDPERISMLIEEMPDRVTDK
jgi:phosphotransferase system enzyme I (PtsI)